ncbi:MAG: type II secretion system F family protein [Proteobacteria bacterium]|nr:type II secretion system F family protein [Pseudomonadota bacterium]
MESVSSNLTGGVSVIESISACLDKLRAPLRNELSLFLILSREHGNIKSIEHCIKKSKTIFLKIFWITLLTHYKNGGALADNIKKLHRTLYLRINIKQRIKAQLLHTKIQFIVGTALPYFLFFIMNILYPYLIQPVLHSGLGIGLLLSAFMVHGVGVYFFYIITRFDMRNELNYSLAFEYMAFSMKNGLSIMTGMNDIKDSGLLDTKTVEIISASKSTSELLSNLAKIKNNYIESLSLILKRGYTLGIAIADDLSSKASDITEKLEQRSLRFQQIAPSKALIPLLLCIFPATYILILTPIIVEVSQSSF